MFLVSSGLATAQFHHMVVDPEQQRTEVVQHAIVEYELVIDFLIRTEQLDNRQTERLRIAAKGVGERRAARFVPHYGEAENVVLAKDPDNPDGPLRVVAPTGDLLWETTLASVLSVQQNANLMAAQKKRASRDEVYLIDRLDHVLLFDSEQRSQVESLLGNPKRKSSDVAIHPAEIGGIDKAKIREILSASQFEVWQSIMRGQFEFNGSIWVP